MDPIATTGANDDQQQQGVQTDPPAQTPPAEPSATTEGDTPPQDLAEAYAAYRKKNAPVATPPVQKGEDTTGDSGDGTTPPPGGELDTPGAEDPGAQATEPPASQTPAAQSVPPTTSGDGGGSTDPATEIDIVATRKQVGQQLAQRAAQAAQAEFAEHGIKRWTTNDLQRRNEQQGTIEFINPDTKQPISRAEAQQWVQAINNDIDVEFKKLAQQKQQALFEEAKPTIAMLEFVNTYNNMDDNTKGIFDDMIEPFAIKDASGGVIGYNCDLNTYHQQAQRLATRFQPAQQQAQAPQQQAPAAPVAPATDITATGSSSTPNKEDEPPKTLQDAMKQVNKLKREGKLNV